MFPKPTRRLADYKQELISEDWEAISSIFAELRLTHNEIISERVNFTIEDGHITGLSIEQTLDYVPERINDLKNLETLMLNVRTPPPLQQLKKLSTLSIQGLEIVEFPNFYARLSQLEFLYLPNLGLKRFPKFIMNLSNLRYLDLSNNQISLIPPTIYKLKKLQVLNVSNNRLETIPPHIGALTSLANLNLSQNQIASIPFHIQHLRNLHHLNLKRNPLDETVEYLLRLPKLTQLLLDSELVRRYSLQLRRPSISED